MEKGKSHFGLNTMQMPAFPVPEGFVNAEDYLRHLARQGLNTRYADSDEVVERRLERECEMVITKGYFDACGSIGSVSASVRTGISGGADTVG
ncbi:MAG: hypothetical protein QGG64_29865 [Candidatus Latescibacteria bacterium]|jgi:DNA polymerase-3 subunit alpha|nr:hypothetical protein [Candidatus Latescibacterota bacterium]